MKGQRIVIGTLALVLLLAVALGVAPVPVMPAVQAASPEPAE